MEYNVLNYVDVPTATATHTSGDLALSLQRTMLRLKGAHMSSDGRGVNYETLRESVLFHEYVALSSQLKQCDPSTLQESQKKAFFINVYNSLTIHGLASAAQLPSSVLEVDKFWRKTAYNIGGHTYSLDDIEHGVLRGNKPHPSASSPQFAGDDPRVVMSLKSCDPRIHFALVCGAKSCPAIQVYSDKNVESALDRAAESFCQQEVVFCNRGVALSKIFQWYSCDFGSTEREVLQWTSKYLSAQTRELLDTLLSSQEDLSVKYTDYNWQLNKL